MLRSSVHPCLLHTHTHQASSSSSAVLNPIILPCHLQLSQHTSLGQTVSLLPPPPSLPTHHFIPALHFPSPSPPSTGQQQFRCSAHPDALCWGCSCCSTGAAQRGACHRLVHSAGALICLRLTCLKHCWQLGRGEGGGQLEIWSSQTALSFQ
jgi:hypothetical protein